MAMLRGRFQPALTSSDHGGTADDAASATVRPGELPTALPRRSGATRPRPLKADGKTPLKPAAISLVRSWPLSRVNGLLTALSEIETLLAAAENDARNEVIYAEISRAYS